jgi:hypothetical protein
LLQSRVLLFELLLLCQQLGVFAIEIRVRDHAGSLPLSAAPTTRQRAEDVGQ